MAFRLQLAGIKIAVIKIFISVTRLEERCVEKALKGLKYMAAPAVSTENE